LKGWNDRQKTNAQPAVCFQFRPAALHFSKQEVFQVTIEQLKAALKKLRADAERLEQALHRHAKNETDPARHAMLFRLAGVLRDFLAVPAMA
jgi:hypothetical protein